MLKRREIRLVKMPAPTNLEDRVISVSADEGAGAGTSLAFYLFLY